MNNKPSIFGLALQLEPKNAEVKARLGRALCLQGWQFAPVMTAEAASQKIIEGERLADEALAIEPTSALAHVPKGLAQMAKGNYPEAKRIFENANSLDRNMVLVLNNLATILVRVGDPASTLKYAEQGIRLDPRGPQVAVLYIDSGTAYFYLGQDELAAKHLPKPAL